MTASPILFPCNLSILLGGGGEFRGFLWNIAKENIHSVILPMIIAFFFLFLTLDELEFRVIDLGSRLRHIIIECSFLVSIFLE